MGTPHIASCILPKNPRECGQSKGDYEQSMHLQGPHHRNITNEDEVVHQSGPVGDW